MGDEKRKGPDPRVEWVLGRMSALMGVRPEKYDKYIQTFLGEQACMQAILSFLEDPDVAFCFFHPTADSVIANSSDFPTVAQMKKKVIAMHRAKRGIEISKDNLAESVVILELSKNVLDLMNSYCHSIYHSTLMNPANQRGWSELISKDLMDKYHIFLANLHVTVGLMKGHTWLPLPPRDALPTGAASQSNNSPAAKDRVHVLEGAVITWTKQIRHVLKQDPEMLLREGRNPEPIAELQFWRSKAANLNSIHSQLGMDALKKVLKFLESHKSTYTNPFARLQKEVEEGREEANDNLKFLSTLSERLSKLMSDSADFETLNTQFDGVMHNILLIWYYSKFYTTPTRLAVLIREICNTVINQAMKFISGPDIFSMIAAEEAPDCWDKLNKTLKVCTSLKDVYLVYRGVTAAQGGEGWRMRNEALFVRLDAFRERCRDAMDFTKTVMQFMKLERVDIGGTKGKALSGCVVTILEEFNQAVETFKNVTYDIMDVDEKQFDQDYFTFRMAIKDLDMRLGSLLSTAFEDLDTLQMRLKLFDSFEGMLERPLIQAELEKKHKCLLKIYKEDLKEVERAFTENRHKVDNTCDDSPIFLNLPPVAGAIYWSRCFRSRISEPMSKLVFILDFKML